MVHRNWGVFFKQTILTQKFEGISCAKSLKENLQNKQGKGQSMRMQETVFGSKKRGLLSKKDAKRGTLFAYGDVNNLVLVRNAPY
jgi:hypothetical protein